MNPTIAQQRLIAQQLAQPRFTTPHEVVAWLGAVQAQDYLGSLWAVGARLPGATEAQLEQAVADKSVVRTWPMRGTLHLVAAADVRWMLALGAPRVVQRAQRRYAQLGLDAAVLAASATVISDALQGSPPLARAALYDHLEQAQIATAGSRGLHILGAAGPRRPDLLRPAAGQAAQLRAARRVGAAHAAGPARRGAGAAGTALRRWAWRRDRARFDVVVGAEHGGGHRRTAGRWRSAGAAA